MVFKLSLRWRILLLIAFLALINISGSAVTVWYTYRAQDLNRAMVDQDLKALVAAQKLETALVMQKGLLTYYFMTGSTDWLKKLEKHHRDFETWLSRAREVNHLAGANGILREIESRYIRFIFDRDKVLDLYKAGKREEGASGHWGVRDQFFKIYELTGEFKQIHEKTISTLTRSLRVSSRKIKYLAWAAVPFAIFISAMLVFVLLRQILDPIRKLSLETNREDFPYELGDEIDTLKTHVHHLVSDIGQTQAKLEQSQEHLLQSEKLAMVGKLAAGVAHSVRNPLTSVKMRLFTLERSLRSTPEQKEDLEVISEEIRHIDTILRNFLEYARPPKLSCQPVSPSEVVDLTVQLLKHRIDSYQAEVTIERRQKLPEIMIDSDQLKEVLVNLIVNSCEAMGENGKITICEENQSNPDFLNAVVIRVQDNGPGITDAMKEKIFQPFFSSKEEGSGLGLSIARRIVEEHGGGIRVESKEGAGAAFIITIPTRENTDGDYIDR